MPPAKNKRETMYEIPHYWTREQKISQLLSIADMFSKKWNIDNSKTTMEPEDIYSVAAVAIIKAVDEWDARKCVKLTTFAYSRAKYAIMEAIKQHSHAPRSMEDKGEVVRWVSLNAPGDLDNTFTLEDQLESNLFAEFGNAEAQAITSCDHDVLKSYVVKLPEKERAVIELYIDDCSPHDIAKLLGLKEGRVYQLITSATEKMQGFHRFSNSLVKMNAWRKGYEMPSEMFEYAQ